VLDTYLVMDFIESRRSLDFARDGERSRTIQFFWSYLKISLKFPRSPAHFTKNLLGVREEMLSCGHTNG